MSEIVVLVMVLVVFAVGIGALALAYWDQRALLRDAQARHADLVEHIKHAATTGRRDLAAAYVDIINAVQFHMPATGQPGVTVAPREGKVHPAPTDAELYEREQRELQDREHPDAQDEGADTES